MTPKQPKPGTQCADLLKHIRAGPTTVRNIFVVLHINSPTKIISELRAMGWDIQDEWIKASARLTLYKLAPYKRYWLER